MKQRYRTRPSVEQMEDRWCPTVTASVKNGILTVAGTPTNSTDLVLVKETAANTFEVDDAGTVVASGLTATSVKLKLTGTTDLVSVDLGGNTLAGNLAANLSNTNTTLTVADGTISGAVRVSGRGTDNVTLGSTGKTLTVAHDSEVDLDNSTTGIVKVLSGVSFTDDLFASGTSVTLAAGATVKDWLVIQGSSSGVTATVNGTVGGGLLVDGGFGGFCGGNSSTSSSTSLTLGSTGSVAGNLYFASRGTKDTLDIFGKVSGNLDAVLLGTTTSATLESGSTIGGRADFDFGKGTDALTIAGTIGTSGNTGTALTVDAGNGGNTIGILSTAVINGSARVRLGSGTNTVSLHDPATVTGTFTLKAGTATTFHGSVQTHHPTLDLTDFKGTQDSSANP
jgi:hypothetical protein